MKILDSIEHEPGLAEFEIWVETSFCSYSDTVVEHRTYNGANRIVKNGPGIDNLLSFTDHSTSNTYYALTDHSGTIHAFTDESGSIVESYEFDAFGRVLGVYDGDGQSINQSAIGNRYLWQGREYSWNTDLYYFRARWYDPITGRWLSNDPIGISGGLNQYVFCGNNPVNFRDAFGLCKELEDSIWQNYMDVIWEEMTGRGSSPIAQAIVDAMMTHDAFHESIRNEFRHMPPLAMGMDYMAGTETVGLGSLLGGAGASAMTEGTLTGVLGGGLWLFLGGEIIWVGVDIFQGLSDR